MDISSPLEEMDLSEDIVVDAFKSDGSSIEKISTLAVLGKAHQNGITPFEYSTWTDLGEDFIFVPRDSSYNAYP